EPLSAVTDRATELGEGMRLEVRQRRMWRQGHVEAGGQCTLPLVAEVTGDTAVDAVQLRKPDLAHAGAESARRAHLTVLLQHVRKADLDRPPLAPLFPDHGGDDQSEEDEREDDEDREVQRLEPGEGVAHATGSSAGGATAARASRNPTRDRGSTC